MKIKRTLSIILILIWACTIFYFSHQQGKGSGNISKTVTMKIIDIVDIQNNISQDKREEIAQRVEPVIRKLAHYSIYILGGILIINCAYMFVKSEKRAIISSSLIGITYAASDEIHQLFINGRTAKITDVLIDSIGILTGIVAYLLVKKIVFKLTKEMKNKQRG